MKHSNGSLWVNEKKVNGKVYTLWRDPGPPKKEYIECERKIKLLNRSKGEKARNVWNDLDKLTKF